MSLNKFSSANKDVEKKYLDIRANSLSIGIAPCTLSVQSYQPIISIALTDGVINNTYLASYHCLGNSLFINGIVDFTTTTTPQNNFRIFLNNLPPNLSSLFLNKDQSVSGYLSEYVTNTLTNSAQIVSSVWNSNTLEITLFYSKTNTSVAQYKIRYFIQINR